MPLIKFFSFFLFLLLLKQSIVVANELDSAFIEQFAKTYLTEQFPSTEEEVVRISVAKLDPRINIKPCAMPLTANIPDKNSQRNVNLKISCDESIPWKIYISAKVEITKAVLVAKNTISKGDKLDESNVELAYMPINKVRGKKITDTTSVFGARATKRIAKGKPINKRSMCLICKGDVVTIIASSSSFKIKAQGVALSSGNIDEQIRVLLHVSKVFTT